MGNETPTPPVREDPDGYLAVMCQAGDEEEFMQPYICRRQATWVGRTKTPHAELLSEVTLCDLHQDMGREKEAETHELYTLEQLTQPAPNPQPRIILIQHDDVGNEIAHTIALDEHTMVLIRRYNTPITDPHGTAKIFADIDQMSEGVTSTHIEIGDFGIHYVFAGKS